MRRRGPEACIIHCSTNRQMQLKIQNRHALSQVLVHVGQDNVLSHAPHSNTKYLKFLFYHHGYQQSAAGLKVNNSLFSPPTGAGRRSSQNPNGRHGCKQVICNVMESPKQQN